MFVLPMVTYINGGCQWQEEGFMKKIYKKGDKPKHELIEFFEDENRVDPQRRWKAPDTIKNGTVEGNYSKGMARKRKYLKKEARRLSRRAWNRDFDLINTRQDYRCINRWNFID